MKGLAGFETERLRVRDWSLDLADPVRRRALIGALGDVLTDPVLRSLPEPLQLSPGGGDEAVAGWIAARHAESAVFLITLRETRALIGLVLLAEDTGATRRSVHLGYLLARRAWGQGLASEVLQGLVAALSGGAGVRLVAGVVSDNPASARVLEKAGFRLDEGLSEPGTDRFARLCGDGLP